MARRGQAAMEFLMTYGWAIMVLLVAISAFAYFGVMNPQKTMPDKCLFTAGINCRDQKVWSLPAAPSTLGVSFVLENKLGERMIIQEVNMTTTYAGIEYHPASNANCDVATVPLAIAGLPNPQTIDADAGKTVTCYLFNAAKPSMINNGQKVNVIIKYRKLTGSLTQTAQGEIQTTVQAS